MVLMQIIYFQPEFQLIFPFPKVCMNYHISYYFHIYLFMPKDYNTLLIVSIQQSTIYYCFKNCNALITSEIFVQSFFQRGSLWNEWWFYKNRKNQK